MRSIIMDKQQVKNIDEIIMSVLFVAGQGVEIEEIADKLSTSQDKVLSSIESLKKKYCGDMGIHVITFKNKGKMKAQLTTNPNYSELITDVLNPIREKALSKATLETMAIIAYKQPITRLEIEAIRGVSSDYAVQVLLSYNLIEVVGRKDVVGKPLLFGTTEEFLKRFELQDLNELPNYEALLERIAVINANTDGDSIYREYDIDDNSDEDADIDEEYEEFGDEELPEFLEGEEDIKKIG